VEVALSQIDEKGYAVPYMAGEQAVYKVGVVFSTKEKTLSEWKVVELKGGDEGVNIHEGTVHVSTCG
jgi:hypothetical protein